MKRSLLILLIIVVFAGYLGTLIARDPGYVLIAYEDYALQTSLWVLLGLVTGLTAAVYVLLRLTGVIRKAPTVYRGWRGHQKSARAGALTAKGMRLLAEGEHQRAGKFLDGGASDSATQAINYLAAARAANEAGMHEERETYLRLAEETDAELARARAVLSAELALDRGDPQAALRALTNVKSNAHIVELKVKALRATGQWRGLLDLTSDLKSVDSDLALEVELEAACQGFASELNGDGERHNLYRSLSGQLKKDARCVKAYVMSLQDRDEVEPLLRSAIKKSWQPELVALYGELGEGTIKTRLKTAESWQKQHSTDGALQYALGCIYEANGEASLARECYARAIELGRSGEFDIKRANLKLGELFAAEGQFERSVEHLKLAIEA